jgi:membrane-associated phospholipid phosphatase
MNRNFIITLIIIVSATNLRAQVKYDSLRYPRDTLHPVKVMCYPYKEKVVVYEKPGHFGFLTGLPQTFSHAAKETFSKKSWPALSAIAGSTLLLLAADQKITDGVNQFSRYINLSADRDYKSIIRSNVGSTPVNVYDFPQNLNSVLYSMGEGSATLAIAGGLFIYGKAKNDFRALQTTSQLMQSLLAVGISTQILKRMSGRESPFVATIPGGRWRPLTNPAVYQKTVSHYDAFPSGHLASMVATFVVISENYPEKRWIKPVGYSLMSVVSLAMINNGVHWASDYPLAIGMGYICGKVTVNLNRTVFNQIKVK